uniref:Myosin tail domain-containing protein n=1 Tax=Parascaris equorum TaxID=6256 RepID=A0A914R605_PAREQ
MSNRLEDQCTLSKKACKEAKDIEQRINEIEHEIDAFRDARTTSDRLLSEKEVECDEMRARLEEQTLATRMQAEKGKKLESESAKLRQELRQSDAINASALDSIQKKSNDTINELKERIITTQKISTKFGNQNIQFQLQIATANSKLQTMQNERSEIRRMHESLCEKISELQKKDAVQVQEIGEFESMKRNITSENNQLKLRQKELYEQINALSNTKAELNETTHLRGVLDDELRSTEELHRKLGIVEGDLQQWRDKFADKTLLPSETVDDVKKKQISVIRELEETLERANCKIADLEKMKMKMKTEVDEANKETERHIALIAQLEKKTKDFNGVVNERKRMADDVSNELEKEQHQSRDLAADLYNEEALKEKLLSE